MVDLQLEERPDDRSKILWLVFVACSGKLADAPASDEIVRLSRDDSQWVMAAKNYANTRFSGLDQINTDNVKRLRVAWTFSTGVLNGHEAAPLVIKDTMYVVTPWPNILYALDLKQAGAIKWVYRPNPSRAAQGVACCDVVNRGAAYAEEKSSSTRWTIILWRSMPPPARKCGKPSWVKSPGAKP